MKIQDVTDISFQKYGRVIHDIDCSELLRDETYSTSGRCDLCAFCW